MSKVGTKIEGTFLSSRPPSHSSKVGKFVKLLYLPRNDFQRNYFQSFSLYFIKIGKNGLQVAENVKIGKSWIGLRGNCSTNF